MCGRFGSYSEDSREVFAEQLDLVTLDLTSLPPHWNIAPGQDVPIVANRHQRRIELMRWGFAPAWIERAEKRPPPINARSETVHENNLFRDALVRHRCLIHSDGFYEWRGKGKHRSPVYIRRRDLGPMVFAGIWAWRPSQHPPAGGERDPGQLSFAILTTEANELIAPVHDRMPLILDPKDWAHWIDPEPADPLALQPLLVAYPAAPLELYPVTRAVNSWTVDGPECILPEPRLF
jgi:putative SOS response-associated peptidase YedK